jgi:hypothetical protein
LYVGHEIIFLEILPKRYNTLHLRALDTSTVYRTDCFQFHVRINMRPHTVPPISKYKMVLEDLIKVSLLFGQGIQI